MACAQLLKQVNNCKGFKLVYLLALEMLMLVIYMILLSSQRHYYAKIIYGWDIHKNLWEVDQFWDGTYYLFLLATTGFRMDDFF